MEGTAMETLYLNDWDDSEQSIATNRQHLIFDVDTAELSCFYRTQVLKQTASHASTIMEWSTGWFVDAMVVDNQSYNHKIRELFLSMACSWHTSRCLIAIVRVGGIEGKLFYNAEWLQKGGWSLRGYTLQLYLMWLSTLGSKSNSMLIFTRLVKMGNSPNPLGRKPIPLWRGQRSYPKPPGR